MRRREFIAALSGAATWPLVVCASTRIASIASCRVERRRLSAVAISPFTFRLSSIVANYRATMVGVKGGIANWEANRG